MTAATATPAFAAPAGTGDRLDLRFVAAALRRRASLVFAIVFVFVAATFVFVARQPYVYSATAEVVLNAREERIAPATTQAEAELPNAERADTEVAVLKSRELADVVATALHLENDPSFNPGPKSTPGTLERLRAMLGVGRGVVARTLTPADIHRAITDTLQAGLTVARSDQTFVLDITYRAGSAVDAARIANEFAHRYAAGQLHRKTVGNDTAIAFLASRLDSLRAQAQTDAERVQRYRLANNLLSTSGSSLTEQEISSYNLAVTTARAQAAEDIARLDTARAQLRGGSNGGDAGEALSSPVVGGLRAREAEVSGRLATLTARYGPKYPDVAKARSELADVQGQIRDEIARIMSNLEARVMVSQQRLASLTGSLTAARGSLADSNRALAGLDDLDRRAKGSQALYESYLNRYKEVVAQAGTEHADARLLSRAEPPLVPSSPRVVLSLVLAAIVGGAVGVVAAIVTELQFAGLTTCDDVERRLGLPCLGSIALPAVAVIVDDPRSPPAEAYRALAETLRQAAGTIPGVIAFTAAGAGEDVGLAALCFAHTLAASGAATVMIACDPHDAAIADALADYPPGAGLGAVLDGTVDVDAALAVDARGLVVVRAAAAGDDRPLTIGTGLVGLVARLQPRFAHIVLAAPPLLDVAAGRSIVAAAEVTILLVRRRSTADRTVRAAVRLLSAKTLQTTGVVLTAAARR